MIHVREELGPAELCRLFGQDAPIPSIAIARADSFEVLAIVTYLVQHQSEDH